MSPLLHFQHWYPYFSLFLFLSSVTPSASESFFGLSELGFVFHQVFPCRHCRLQLSQSPLWFNLCFPKIRLTVSSARSSIVICFICICSVTLKFTYYYFSRVLGEKINFTITKYTAIFFFIRAITSFSFINLNLYSHASFYYIVFWNLHHLKGWSICN